MYIKYRQYKIQNKWGSVGDKAMVPAPTCLPGDKVVARKPNWVNLFNLGNNLLANKNLLRSLRIFTAFLFLIITKNIAQEKEYLVTNSNDTIYGKISRGINYLNTSEVRFKIRDAKGDKSLINPGEVKIIRSLHGVDGDCFIATIYKLWFLKRIIQGKINVYQLVDGVLFFTSKEGSEIKSTDFGGLNSRKKGLEQIRPLIEDNPVILKEFDSIKGSQNNILEMIRKYNNYAK